jgi:hypothetical protein
VLYEDTFRVFPELIEKLKDIAMQVSSSERRFLRLRVSVSEIKQLRSAQELKVSSTPALACFRNGSARAAVCGDACLAEFDMGSKKQSEGSGCTGQLLDKWLQKAGVIDANNALAKQSGSEGQEVAGPGIEAEEEEEEEEELDCFCDVEGTVWTAFQRACVYTASHRACVYTASHRASPHLFLAACLLLPLLHAANLVATLAAGCPMRSQYQHDHVDESLFQDTERAAAFGVGL